MTEDSAVDRTNGSERPLRVGLVLGGGGAVGAAYHAGVLAALQHDLGWDARHAQVIVGTSAGSLVGALLRAGVPATDMSALHVGGSALQTSDELLAWHGSRRSFSPFGLSDLLQLPRMPGASAVVGLTRVLASGGVASLGALTVLLRDGDESMEEDVQALQESLGSDWPEDPLLVCTTMRRRCRRVVFGDGQHRAGLAAAISASCAVPGYFRGVDIDGETYVDGGVISATNADVLGQADIDLAIVVSPMTGHAPFPSVSHLVRSTCRQILDRELRTLRRAGIATMVIEPGRSVVEVMSDNFMDELVADVVRCAFIDTGQQILESETLQLLNSSAGVRTNGCPPG